MGSKRIACFSKEEMIERINEHFHQILRENLYEMDLNREEVSRLLAQKEELRMYLKRAGTGDRVAKDRLILLIQESLLKLYGMDEEKIASTYFWAQQEKDSSIQFEIMLYLMEKEVGMQAFEVLVQRYHLIENSGHKPPEITADAVKRTYGKVRRNLSFPEKLELLARNIYAFYKGLGVIDTLRDMELDGVSGGVSGEEGNQKSVWVFYKGRSVHLSFLDFRLFSIYLHFS